MPLSEAQIEEIATRAAARVALTREDASTLVSEAVRQTLLQMGIDSSNPLEMQRDFQHLRQWRKAGEDLRGKGMLVLISIFLTGLVGVLLVGVREWIDR